MKLLVRDLNDKKRPIAELVGITGDGWVVGKTGAFGDYKQDCEFILDMKGYLKDFRKANNLSQLELSWMLGMSRPTYITLEQGKRGLTLKEFLILSHYLPDTEFSKLRRNAKGFKSIT